MCAYRYVVSTPYRSTTLEPMRAQNAMSTVSNGTGLHTCVGEEGVRGTEREGDLARNICTRLDINGNHKRSK